MAARLEEGGSPAPWPEQTDQRKRQQPPTLGEGDAIAPEDSLLGGQALAPHYLGTSTPSTTCTTPLAAMMSALITVAAPPFNLT